MKKISISPSLLESYRIARTGLFGKTADDLANDVLGIRHPNEAMSRGTAYHKLLEYGGAPFAVAGGFRVPEPELAREWFFTTEAADPALRLRDQYATMIHELKTIWRTSCQGYEVQMMMRFDGLNGTEVHEFKTKARAPSYLDYFDAMQWRCYLMAFPELTAVNYTVFQLTEKNDRCQLHEFSMTRDDDTEATVHAHLTGFIAWLESRPELIEHLMKKADRPADYGRLEAW